MNVRGDNQPGLSGHMLAHVPEGRVRLSAGTRVVRQGLEESDGILAKTRLLAGAGGCGCQQQSHETFNIYSKKSQSNIHALKNKTLY